jgi:hypothetical protein
VASIHSKRVFYFFVFVFVGPSENWIVGFEFGCDYFGTIRITDRKLEKREKLVCSFLNAKISLEKNFTRKTIKTRKQVFRDFREFYPAPWMDGRQQCYGVPDKGNFNRYEQSSNVFDGHTSSKNVAFTNIQLGYCKKQ